MTMLIRYCYCDLADDPDKQCNPDSRPECEFPYTRCKHFQCRRAEGDKDGITKGG